MAQRKNATRLADLLLKCMAPDPMLSMLEWLCAQLMEAEIQSIVGALSLLGVPILSHHQRKHYLSKILTRIKYPLAEIIATPFFAVGGKTVVTISKKAFLSVPKYLQVQPSEARCFRPSITAQDTLIHTMALSIGVRTAVACKQICRSFVFCGFHRTDPLQLPSFAPQQYPHCHYTGAFCVAQLFIPAFGLGSPLLDFHLQVSMISGAKPIFGAVQKQFCGRAERCLHTVGDEHPPRERWFVNLKKGEVIKMRRHICP